MSVVEIVENLEDTAADESTAVGDSETVYLGDNDYATQETTPDIHNVKTYRDRMNRKWIRINMRRLKLLLTIGIGCSKIKVLYPINTEVFLLKRLKT